MCKNGTMYFLPYPPGTRDDETFKIVIGIDASGSMVLPRYLKSLSAGSKSIIENDLRYETTVLHCDTRILAEYRIKKLDDIRPDIYGGGTTLAPMLKRAQELNCDVALIFTDGLCDDFTQVPRADMPKKVIWVIPRGADDRYFAGTGSIIRID